MPYQRPEIVSGVTKLNKPFFDNLLDGVDKSAAGLQVTNLAGLQRWGDARGAALVRPVVLGALGDSISWGVGSDDTSNSTGADDIMRERAWNVQLRKRLNRAWGVPDAHGWLGMRPNFASGPVTSGTTASGSIGPFGGFSGGGLSLPPEASVTYPKDSSKLGKFTEIDVWYWGVNSAVSGARVPLVTIDGVARNAPTSANAEGNLMKVTVKGLEDTTHDVVISNGVSGGYVYTFAVTVRRADHGFQLNRIARSGATSSDVGGTSNTGEARARNLDAAIMDADLLMVALGTNDQGNQIPLDTYRSNLQEIIDRQVARGGCVLLLGEPPRAVQNGTILEDEYRAVMKSLAGGENEHVAYTDWRDFFGTGAEAYHRGLFPDYNTVHPSAKGHGVIANAMFELLTLPHYL